MRDYSFSKIYIMQELWDSILFIKFFITNVGIYICILGQFKSFDPIIIVFLWNSSLGSSFSEPKHWIFQGFLDGFIQILAFFQIFKIQIEQNHLGDVFKSWILDDIFQIHCRIWLSVFASLDTLISRYKFQSVDK